MKRLCQNGLAVLMSSAVLAATLMPPPVCHSHAAADTPHSHAPDQSNSPEHEQVAGESHSHRDLGHGTANHQHGSAADGAVRPSAAADGAEGSHREAAHLHLTLIGFAFSLFLPVGSDSHSLDPTHPKTLLAVVLLDDDVMRASRVELIGADGVPAAVPGETPVAVSAASSLRVSGIDPLLLCDSARCERSGVLLI